MKSKALLVLLVGIVIITAAAMFRVQQTEIALKLRLGKVEKTDYTPGLHFRVPFVDEIFKFDARIQTLDSDPQQYLTSEKKNVIVDSFVKWRINRVENFYTAVGGSIPRANDRLSVMVQKHLKDAFGKRPIQELVSGDRSKFMGELRTVVESEAKTLGITIVDARIKRVDLPSKVSQSVYDRMGSERKQAASLFRAEGQEQARRIRAQADREQEVIVAEADRDGQKMRGDGDSQATQIFAEAFSQDKEFYTFFRSLDAYKNTFSNRSDIIMLKPDSKFFRYYKDSSPK
jgi:membrane protease subunit HflC